MSSPSDFAKSEIKFDKIDDLPKGGKAATADQIMAAMRVLHKMIHAQAHAYGGKNSKLLPAGIAESLLKSVANVQLDEVSMASVDDDLEAAYMCCNRLQRRINDEESMELLLDIIRHINSALAKAHGK